VFIVRKKKNEFLLRAVTSEPKFTYVRSAPILMAKTENHIDSIGLVDVFELRMVGMSFLYRASSSSAKSKFLNKLSQIASRLQGFLSFFFFFFFFFSFFF